ncbi:MAG TPA: biopolymer transporter ExbD [Elusimicrobiota bacterium]|nr:biopolymer transporter ExbD [Elusimicrobiota bacterium]
MAGPAGNSENSLITGINITPLVDVVLVLLIIFMATAPLLMRRALSVNVPRAAHNEPKATATLQIQMTAVGEVSVEKKKLDLEQLDRMLRERLLTDPALHVSLAADKTIPYGEVVGVMDVVRGAGVKKLALEVKSK